MSTTPAAAIDEQFVLRQAAAAYTVEIDGEAIVLDEERNRLHLLNASGAVVWACCDGSGTVAEIAADLAHAVGVAVADATADVLTLARQLGAEGLLDGVEPDDVDAGVEVPIVELSDQPLG